MVPGQALQQWLRSIRTGSRQVSDGQTTFLQTTFPLSWQVQFRHGTSPNMGM